MTPELADQWEAEVRRMLAETRSRVRPDFQMIMWRDSKRVAAFMRTMQGCLSGGLDDPTTAEVCRATLALERAARRDGREASEFAKAVALAYARVMGRMHEVPAHEAAVAADGVDGPWGDVARRVAPVVRRDGFVDFRYLSAEPVAGVRGLGLVARVGTVPITSLSPDAAPVVAMLGFPAWDGEARDPIGLRFHDGRWLRPVLAPGGWTPADENAFRAACASGQAWVDDPFHLLPRDRAALGVLDEAAPPQAWPEGVRRPPSAQIAASLAARLVRAPELFLVDGVVHRTTGAPGLHLDVTNLYPDGRVLGYPVVSVGWHLGDDVDSTTDQATLSRRCVARIDELVQGRPPQSPGFLRIPLTEADLAGRLAADLASGRYQTEAFRYAKFDDARLVEVIDASPFPSVPGEVAKDVLRELLAQTAATYRSLGVDLSDAAAFQDALDEGLVPEDAQEHVMAPGLNAVRPKFASGLHDLATALIRAAKEEARIVSEMVPDEEVADFRP